MSGSLALVGSGEYLPAMSALERTLIEDGIARGKKPLFVQLPTAAGQEGEDRLAYWERLGKVQAETLGVEQVFLPIFDRADAIEFNDSDLISRSALIYLSGGDPHHLARSLLGTPLFDAISSAWMGGSSLAGCSAGAMVMSTYVPHFRLSRHEPTQGLGLIPNLRIIPHFDKFFRWIPESAAQRLLQVASDEILLGIDELTALVRRSGEDAWEVQGQASVHLLKGLPEARLSHGETVVLPSAH